MKKIKEYAGIMSIVVTIAIFSFGTLRDCSQSEKIENLDYIKNALENRPVLTLMEPPRIDSTIVFLDSLKTVNPLKDTIVFGSGATVGSIYAHYEIYLTFKYKNKGSSQAILAMTVAADTNSGSYFLSLSKIMSNRFLKKYYDKDFYKLHYILPGDSIEIKMNKRIQCFDNQNNFTIHFRTFYVNDIGAMFSTYNWIRFKMPFSEYRIEGEPRELAKIFDTMPTFLSHIQRRKLKNKFVRYIDQNEIADVLEKEHTEKIKSLF